MDNTVWQWSAKDFQSMRYWAVTDLNHDLVMLAKSNRFAATKTVLNCARQKLKLTNTEHLGFKMNFTLAEWETWLAFELCPTIELSRAPPNWEWTWKTIEEDS